jgi:hypothetical protein
MQNQLQGHGSVYRGADDNPQPRDAAHPYPWAAPRPGGEVTPVHPTPKNLLGRPPKIKRNPPINFPYSQTRSSESSLANALGDAAASFAGVSHSPGK